MSVNEFPTSEPSTDQTEQPSKSKSDIDSDTDSNPYSDVEICFSPSSCSTTGSEDEKSEDEESEDEAAVSPIQPPGPPSAAPRSRTRCPISTCNDQIQWCDLEATGFATTHTCPVCKVQFCVICKQLSPPLEECLPTCAVREGLEHAVHMTGVGPAIWFAEEIV